MLSNELRYFFAVATTGSLSTASEQLYVAGSAISRQIQKLETRLGVTLFERHARGMVLTDAGQILANHVRKNMRDMELTLAEIQGLKAVRKALVRLACTDGMAFDLLPGLLARFREQHPGVSFDLQVGTAMQVAEWIRRNDCDVAFQFSLAPERDVEIIAAWPAPVLLLLARVVQGFSTGGEYGGAATFIAEYSTDRNRGLMGSWLEFGTLGGYIAGAGTVTALHMVLSSEQMLDWGWRIPFLVAGPLGLLGLYMRMKLEETPAFRAFAEEAEKREHDRPGLGALFQVHGRQLLVCMGLVLVFNVTDYMLLTYMPSYLSVTMGYAESKGLLLIIIVMLVMMPLNIVGGLFSDRLGRRPMIIGACIALLVLAVPCLLLVGSGNDGLIFLGLMLLGLALVCFTSSMPSTLPALFYTPVRYSALSIAFNVSVSLFGGTTPLVTAWLVERTGDPLVPAYYLMGAAVIGLVTMLFVKETAGLPLRGSPPAVGSDKEAAALLKSDVPVTVDPTLPPLPDVAEPEQVKPA